ncbi:hypothetical protein JK635_07905 [Neobacillus sp. YIM B02564]|uniref:Uncharacterized protein n=1 Tax=Neobacillus paridis TaxID=2803862 RepID=A0ABS1TLD3_9BACI|nr:hypothetical protein [Neobacillus paridis]MBL4952134.1 hypothetical protein [Neobacillus paridis]
MAFFGRKEDLTPAKSETIFLENHAKTLELNIMKLEEQMNQTRQLAEGYRADARKHMSELQRVAQTICDNDFAKEQLGGKNRILSLSSFELANFIIDNWKKQRQEAINLIIELQKSLKRKEGEYRDLEAQLERVLTEQRDAARENQEYPSFDSPLHEEIKNMEPSEILSPAPEKDLKLPVADDIVKVVKQSTTLAPPSPAPVASTHEDHTYRTPKTHLVLMDDIEKQMNDLSWSILEGIGKEGLSESKEIANFVKDRFGDFSQSQFTTALNGLKTNLIVAEDKVNTGWRWFFAFHLTDLGLQLFQKRFKKPAVLCEKHVLRKENATWDHGYTIKDTATLMEMMGYKDITYSRSDNEIKLSNGKTWIPDITAYDTLSNKKVYVEVELGHHTQKEFNEKMDKARQVAHELRFVTNAKQSMETIVQQFSRWKLEKSKQGNPVKNFDVYITTTKKLSDKDWGNHYPS